MPAWDRPRLREPEFAPDGQRSFTVTRAAQTFRRNGFQCRYCGTRIISVALMTALSTMCPAELPYDIHSKQGEIQAAYWLIGAEADHIQPGSVGDDRPDIGESHP
jgi:hypothetical protein